MFKFLFYFFLRIKLRPTKHAKNLKDSPNFGADRPQENYFSDEVKRRRGDSDELSKAFNASTALPVDCPLVLKGPAYIIDGDTIRVQKTQVRLFGIDAPELHHPYGEQAKWAMVRLCKGHQIRAEITDVDEYGRTVAKCTLPDGRDLSAELVKQGLAIDWPKFSGGQYSSLEVSNIRKKLWLADARQKGRMHVWKKFEGKKTKRP